MDNNQYNPNNNPYQQQGQFGTQQPNPYNQQQVQYGDPSFGTQQQYNGQQYGGQQFQQVPAGSMPNPNTYLVLVIIGFVCGVIWGALTVSNYTKLKQAVAANNYAMAQDCAKKIRTVIIIGVIINVLVFIGRLSQAGVI